MITLPPPPMFSGSVDFCKFSKICIKAHFLPFRSVSVGPLFEKSNLIMLC